MKNITFAKHKNNHSNLVAWIIIAMFLAGWEMLVRVLSIPVYLLPAPSKILTTIWQNPENYIQGSAITFGEALAGLMLGIIAGVLIASILTLLPGLEDGIMTLAILVKSTPLVAIAPLLTLWLGFGVLPKIIITGLLSFFPVLINMIGGLQRVDPPLIDLFRSWNTSRWEMFRFLRVPSSIPYLFSALKIAAPLSMIGAVVAEWTGASGGLGRIMWLAYSNLNLPFLFGAIFILAAAGIILYRLLSWLETKAVFWQPTQLNE